MNDLFEKYGYTPDNEKIGRSLELIASGKAPVEEMVSKCVPLAEGNEWIHKVYNREDGLSKIVLIP